MTRDYSKFLPSSDSPEKPPASPLVTYGWQPFFSQQIGLEDLEVSPPSRVFEVHRNRILVRGDSGDTVLPMLADVTVGDWVLVNAEQPADSIVLDRKSLIKRRAPGRDFQVQLIAANIDTAFIVTSCNQDFNVARLERYIALAFEAEIAPVIILTKVDLVEDISKFKEEAAAISEMVPVVALNAKSDAPGVMLASWCKPGQTVAFLGSSGVGKSTLTNALLGSDLVATQDIREEDAKGRHTTRSRELHVVRGGCLVLDTPGMRELQLTDVASGIGDVFSDIRDLAGQCKFNDCQHETEPGCAVRAAIDAGDIDQARLGRWRKLIAEEAFNTASLSERRTKDRQFGKMVRDIMREKKKRR